METEAKGRYFLNPYISVIKFPKISLFLEKSRNREKIGNFIKSSNSFFDIDRLVMSKSWFFLFTNLHGHRPGFTKVLVSTYQKKAVTFEVKYLETSYCATSCLIWCPYKSQIMEAFEIYFWCVKQTIRRMVQFCTTFSPEIPR